MAKKKVKGDIKHSSHAVKASPKNRVSRTTILIYVVVITLTIILLSIMGSSQGGGGGGGCCDCSNCRCICCCNDCEDCHEDCGCMGEGIGGVEDPYTRTTISASSYYCRYGSMPPVPPVPQCTEYETKLCDEQRGVCEGAYITCTRANPALASTARWPDCDADYYRAAAETLTYQQDEDICDGHDNDCDGDRDEDCDEDDDGYCNNDMVCTGSKFNCGDVSDGVAPPGSVCTDCDDSNPTVHPNADEVCDGIDNDCDHQVDEGCECSPIGATQECQKQKGVCQGLVRECKSCDEGDCDEEGQNSHWVGCSYSSIEGYRSPESGAWYCGDGLDNDCDGRTDCEDSGCFAYCIPSPP